MLIAQVSLAYHPTNMTISLLPVISEDGEEMHWENQGASLSYVEDIDRVRMGIVRALDEGRVGVFRASVRALSRAVHVRLDEP